MSETLNIVAFESSCDETGVAIVRVAPDGTPSLLADALHSQVAMHRPYGGVVPELASRDHIRRVVGLTRQAMADAGVAMADLHHVAYTAGPGLAGALLVGAGVAHGLAFALERPVQPVHHLEGHLFSPFISGEPPMFPFVALLVSGGHTQLMQVDAVDRCWLLGESIDDAAGEAFDKSAMLLGLGYPGGAALSRLAQQGDPAAYDLPRPLMRDRSLDFSFSGLKTAVATRLQRLGPGPLDERVRADMAASVEAAIVDVLVGKTRAAMALTGCSRLVIAGGVGANRRLRERLLAAGARDGFSTRLPDPRHCTDNAAMIGYAAALRLAAGCAPLQAPGEFTVRPRWPLGDAPGVGSRP